MKKKSLASHIPTLEITSKANLCTLIFAGSFTTAEASVNKLKKSEVYESIDKAQIEKIIIDSSGLKEWDVTLLAFIVAIQQKAKAKNIEIEYGKLDEKIQELVDIALHIPLKSEAKKQDVNMDFLEAVGDKVLKAPKKISITMDFIKEIFSALKRLCLGKSQMEAREFWQAIKECGVDALPIVSLTSMLLGLILAFVGAIQLRMFGAEVYVASLVGLSMVRIMGALLTGIVLSGRTGANFAAVLGTMQVNEEIDALKTFGISPFDFLVLPRLIALTLMTPLLTLYANCMGILGGFVVGVLMLNISTTMYIDNTLQFMSLSYLWIGLFHALIFGIIIAVAGCFQGYFCGRNAEAVGKATTMAVVNSIVGIIIATSVITVGLTIMDL